MEILEKHQVSFDTFGHPNTAYIERIPTTAEDVVSELVSQFETE